MIFYCCYKYFCLCYSSQKVYVWLTRLQEFFTHVRINIYYYKKLVLLVVRTKLCESVEFPLFFSNWAKFYIFQLPHNSHEANQSVYLFSFLRHKTCYVAIHTKVPITLNADFRMLKVLSNCLLLVFPVQKIIFPSTLPSDKYLTVIEGLKRVCTSSKLEPK